MGSLRKLSLYSNFYWGFYPKLSLEGIHCPNLQSLTLGNFIFFENQQLDWILSHSATLQELYLDDCSILLQARILDDEDQLSKCPVSKHDMKLQNLEDMGDDWYYYYPGRWNQYFRSFEACLPRLHHFAIGHNEAWDTEDAMPFENEREIAPALMVDRYMAFDGGIGPSQFVSPRWRGLNYPLDWPQCDDEDRDALKSLFKKINQQVDCGEIPTHRSAVVDLLETDNRR